MSQLPFRQPAILAMADPLLSEEYCHSITPPFHLPSYEALLTACAKTEWSIHPVFVASFWFTGFPTIILLSGTPFWAISLTDVPGKYPPD